MSFCVNYRCDLYHANQTAQTCAKCGGNNVLAPLEIGHRRGSLDSRQQEAGDRGAASRIEADKEAT